MSQVAIERKPEVVIRLSDREAIILRTVLGGTSTEDDRLALQDHLHPSTVEIPNEDARVCYNIYNDLVKLELGDYRVDE